MSKANSVTFPILLNGITLEDFKEIIQGFLKEHPNYSASINNRNNEQGSKVIGTYLSRGQVAKHLQISLPTLHSYVKQGLIKSYRIGGKVRFKLEEVDQALTERNFTSVMRKGGNHAA